jgi:syntaxin-binding protein 1
MDEATTKIVSSALTMYDIMEHRVTLVEQLDKIRQPFPEMDVIYFITPTIESVNLVIEDFPSLSKAKYGNVHLFFSDTVSYHFKC